MSKGVIGKGVIALITLLAICSTNNAQVTIGLKKVPRAGALLELQNIPTNQNDIETANKGLGLPRVQLSVIDKLKMGKLEIMDGIDNQYSKHTGLIVFNVNHFCEGDFKIHYPGLYVWDGSRWQALQEAPYAETGKTWVTQDQEGKNFRAAKFGDAGIWMIDNLAVTTYDTEANPQITMPTNPGTQSNQPRAPLWAYPAPNPAPNPLPAGATGAINGSDPYYYDNFREYGLLYNWMAATGGTSSVYGPGNWTANDALDQIRVVGDTPGPNEVESMETKGYIQGICPNDWHLPSDREWSMLEKEIFNNTEKYSYISKEEKQTWSPNTWQNNWDEFNQAIPENIYQGWRAGNANDTLSNLAMAMKRPCVLAYQNSDQEADMFSRGKSFLPDAGGFNAIPAGDIADAKTRYYGQIAGYYSSSYAGRNTTSETLRQVYSRSFNFDPNLHQKFGSTIGLINKGRPNVSDLTSIRCVYHGTQAPF